MMYIYYTEDVDDVYCTVDVDDVNVDDADFEVLMIHGTLYMDIDDDCGYHVPIGYQVIKEVRIPPPSSPSPEVHM
jgi:hypothetical protein